MKITGALLLLSVSLLPVLAWPSMQGDAAQDRAGTISGTVRNGTAGAMLPDGLRVQLIAVPRGGTPSAQETVAEGGRFRFSVVTDASITYLLRVVYQGVQYFNEVPILISPDLPDAEGELTVYETSSEPPPLRVERVTVRVLALDRENAQLAIEREDLVVNPTDRVYVASEDNVTLRLPAPENVVMANGASIEGSFTLDGESLAVTMPLRPGTNSVVTRYLVGYDRDRDTYRLRVTTPLEAGRIAIQVPQRFVERLVPLEDAQRAPAVEVEGEQLLVVELPGEVAAGRSAVAELRGLSGRQAPNPLTEMPGAAVGSGAAAVLIAIGGMLRLRRSGRPKRNGS